MSKAYNYVDNQHLYINPKTGLLKTLLYIEDGETLIFVESGIVIKRLNELYEKPIKIEDSKELYTIHKHLFQDIYEWAGKRRLVEISKDGKQFFPTSHFDTAHTYIDSLIAEYRKLSSNDVKNIAQVLGDILDNINYLHPFRDGNGRVQREFLRILALERGFELNLNPIDNKSVYERYMKGTVHSDVKILTNLIFELISNKKN